MTRGDDLLKQSIFYAFRMVSARKGGISLRSSVDGPGYTSERYGAVNYLDQAAVIDGDRLHVFALNRHVEDAMQLTVECADREIVGVADSEILHADLKAENTFDVPDVVTAQGSSTAGSRMARRRPNCRRTRSSRPPSGSRSVAGLAPGESSACKGPLRAGRPAHLPIWRPGRRA